MKAMILAAGEGRRLRPLTNHLPKPMLPVGGKPLLEHIIINLRHSGITEFAVNLHHLPQAVTDYFGDGSRLGVKLRYSIEDRLLGSAGGVKRVEDFFDEPFVVYYGDVFTLADIRPMIAHHYRSGVLATMGLYPVPDPWNRGIVEMDAAHLITRFVEKPAPEEAFSNLANAGIYVLEPDILSRIPADQPFDFGRDVFPALLADGQRVAGYVIGDTLIDIGLPEKYEEANLLVQRLER